MGDETMGKSHRLKWTRTGGTPQNIRKPPLPFLLFSLTDILLGVHVCQKVLGNHQLTWDARRKIPQGLSSFSRLELLEIGGHLRRTWRRSSAYCCSFPLRKPHEKYCIPIQMLESPFANIYINWVSLNGVVQKNPRQTMVNHQPNSGLPCLLV